MAVTQKVFRYDDVPNGLLAAFKKLVKEGKKPTWTPVMSADGQIIGMGSPNFGNTQLSFMLKIEDGKPVEVLYSLMLRENGAIDEATKYGTPSVFITPVKLDPQGNIMFGMIDERRPVIRERFQLRPNNTYLDRQGNLQTWVEGDPNDQIVLLPEGRVDVAGEEVNRTLYRWGVTVKGIPGGYGAKNLSDLESAAAETAEEVGISNKPRIAIRASMDRAWAPVLDHYGLVFVHDESMIRPPTPGEHEMIGKLKWFYADEIDFTETPDNHCLVSMLATCFHLGLIGRTPTARPWNQNEGWWTEVRRRQNQSQS